jgi:hypothetical protein
MFINYLYGCEYLLWDSCELSVVRYQLDDSGKECNFVSAHVAKAYREFAVYFYTFLSSVLEIVGHPQLQISVTQGREYPEAVEYLDGCTPYSVRTLW